MPQHDAPSVSDDECWNDARECFAGGKQVMLKYRTGERRRETSPTDSRSPSARDQMPVGNAISRARLRASRAMDHVYIA